MPDPKRERQRQNREAARQAQLEAARQAKRKQSTVRMAVVAVAAVVLAVLAAALFGGKDDKKKVDATNSTSTTVGVTTTTVDQAALAKVQCNDTKPPDNPNRPTFKEPPPMTIDAAKKYTATIDTSCGKITVELDPKAAPKTVNSFVFLAKQKFFDGLTWHRVVKDFVIQGGDPQGTGSGGPGYEFADELPQGANVYLPGVLAMANSGPNTNGSQFFIVTGNGGLRLQNNYNVFGKVTDGLIVAQKLETFAQDPADPNGKPSRPLYISSVTIKEG